MISFLITYNMYIKKTTMILNHMAHGKIKIYVNEFTVDYDL